MIKTKKAVSVFVGLMTGVALSGVAAVMPLVASAETYNFTAQLKLGSKGTEVMNLQKVLNSDPSTQVSLSGAGAPGAESTYFGSKTKAAVVKFQAKYGISQVGQTGPVTRAKLNSLFGSGVPGGVVVPGTDLVVTLASDSPLAGALINGQAVGDLAHFTLTNKGSVEAKVTGIALNRTGISNDATLANVYLYEGAKRLTDAAAVSQTKITFNDLGGILLIPSGSSKTIAVKADIAAGTAGQLVGVSLASVTSNVAVSSMLPVGGHIMSIANATLAGVNFANTTSPTGTPAVDPQDGYVMWQNSVSITTRAVDMKSLALRQIGSVSSSDLRNFKLYVDGTQVGMTVASLDANGYVTFDLTASPVRLQTGTRIIKVVGDIVGGSTRTFSFSLRQPGDAMMVDTELGQTVLAQANSTTFAARTTGTNSVNSGTLTITKKTDSPSGNVVADASNVVLGKFEFKAAGEPIKVENLLATVNVSTAGVGSLRNGAVFANGAQVGSTAALAEANTTYNMGSSLVVYPGSPVVVEIRADIYDGDGTPATFAAGETITAGFAAGLSNMQKMNSLNYISNSAVNANQLTLAVGALSMSKNLTYGNQTTVVPATAYKVAAYNLIAGSAEGVLLDTITVNFPTASSTDVYVRYGTKTTAVKQTVTAGNNTFSINELMTANQSLPIEVYATLPASSFTTGHTEQVTVTVSGTTAQSSLAKATSAITGQLISVNTGTITSSFVADSAYSTKLVVGGSEQKVASFKFAAENDNFTITDIATKVTDVNSEAAINYVILKSGSTVLATTPISTLIASSTGLSVSVPANTEKSIDVYLSLNNVGPSLATSTANVKVTLEGFKYTSSTGTQGEDATDRSGTTNDIYVVKTIPTITSVALPETILDNKVMTIARVQVSTDAAGPLAWKRLAFSVSKSSNVNFGSVSTMVMRDAGNNVVAGSFATSSGDTLITFTATDEQPAGTYSVNATIAGISAAGYYSVSTNVAATASAIAVPNTYAGATTGSFVWSDKSSLSHSELTPDWINDYKVLGLPTISQSITKTI